MAAMCFLHGRLAWHHFFRNVSIPLDGSSLRCALFPEKTIPRSRPYDHHRGAGGRGVYRGK